jgi:hypothetical protein
MKTYTKPETTAVELQQSNCLLQASVKSINGCDFELGGGAAVDARTREDNLWEEEW